MQINVELPEKLDFLLGEKARYKVAYGGRASAKSWSFARALLTRGVEQKTRALCTRELQKSIKDSVHQLLTDQIAELNLGYYYNVQQSGISAYNGTEIGFAGLKHNTVELKSYEGVDICWLEEAQVASKKSWEILVPTIRKPDSEIWASFNPELEEDETYKRFVLTKPKNSIVVKIGWQDNPWFPEVLRQEMEELKAKDPDAYMHVWEGHCKQVLDGAIFAKELREAKLNGYVGDYPHNPTKPVHTFWDLGWNSVTGRTAVIMAQSVGPVYHIIDYLEDAEHSVDWYISELQKKNYTWGIDNLPHDATSTNMAAGGRTVAGIMKSLGRNVRVLKRTQNVGNDINAAKIIFGQCRFNATKTADLWQCLNRYSYSIDEDTGLRSKTPQPNIWIHGADAFRTMAVSINEEKMPIATKKRVAQYSGPGAWMG